MFRSAIAETNPSFSANYSPCGSAASCVNPSFSTVCELTKPRAEVWSSIIIVILGLYILYDQVGISFVAAVVVTVCLMGLAPLISRKIGPITATISSFNDKRIGLTSGILRQIKGVKLSAFEPELTEKVRTLRVSELGARRQFWRKFGVVVCLTNITMNMLTLFTLGCA